MTSLERAILRTVAYFDLFNYPLTTWEVWKWGMGGAGEPHSYRAVRAALVLSVELQEKLAQASGFVFLKGREELVAIRQARYRLALQKLDRARRFTKTLTRLPYVRAVFACNSLGLANARVESDIDFFIVVRRGHVWAVRLLAAGWARLRKLRPQPGNRQDTFCLSFFLADDCLDLSAIRLSDDPYLTVWLATLVPLYDPDNFATQLWQANAWAREALPQAAPRAASMQHHARASVLRCLFLPFFGHQFGERLAERIQRRVLAPNLRVLANQDTRVILNRHMLKFHDNDRRQEYAQALTSRLANLGV